MRPLILALGLAAALAACDDDDGHTHSPDRGTSVDGGVDARLPDGTVPDGTVPDGTVPDGTVPDGSVPAVTACLDRPGTLPRPATGLPCELLPPGFGR